MDGTDELKIDKSPRPAFLRRPMRRITVAVAKDQIGLPTPIYRAAERLPDLAELMIAGNPNVPRILHVAGSPPVSRADWVIHFFDAISRAGGRHPSLRLASLASFPSIASRPNFSALD